MSDSDRLGFNSLAVHAGYHAKQGPVNPPVERSSTYVFSDCDDGARRFASQRKEGIYARLYSPGVAALEAKIAALERGYGGIATASGMAAVEAAYFTFLEPGAHVVCTDAVYGPSRSILEKPEYYLKWGIKATFLDTSKEDKVKEAVKFPGTRLLFVETPANPTLAISDIARMAEIANETGIILVVDNTFCSPYLQNPLSWGADVVLHSMTKSIGGHATAVGGMLVTKTEENFYRLRETVINRGSVLSPDNADLFNSGVKTLGLRMEKMQSNAVLLAEYLNTHELVEWVNYPGLQSHRQHNLVKSGRQMHGPGSMLTFGVKGGYDRAKRLLNNLRLITLAVSLGGVETLVQHPASMTHAGIPENKREAAGISSDLIRLSVGIEDIDDLKGDFKQAFAKL